MARRDHSDLTIAIIHYQTPELLERCLTLVRGAAPGARLLVVDTGEDEPLPAEWPERHEDILLLHQPNHSYAAAVNRALRHCSTHCSTQRFAHLNADVLVAPGTFDDLARALDETGAAMAGPLLRNGQGRLQRHGLPYRRHQWLARIAAGGRVPVPWLSGSIQYLRVDAALRVGGMDTSLRFYNEDMEWCLRMRAAGLRCLLLNSEAVHLGGSSTPPSTAFLVEGLRGGYQLARRYRGPLTRLGHRFAVAGAAGLLGAFAGNVERRRAYGQVASMLWRDDISESPFGATLGSRNPRFPGDTGPSR
jgi:N-acetylglucosaminyl-diphospho-decaprenol L-rhamnosyltransferase